MEYDRGLLKPLLDYKYRQMTKSPFHFFRGSCKLFYDHLSSEPLPPSPVGWCCGDLHFQNFGSYKGDNRLVYFDLNDFDEAALAPLNWELARFLTCIFIYTHLLKGTSAVAKKLCRSFLNAYSETLRDGRPLYLEEKTSDGIVKSLLQKVRRRDQDMLLKKRTERVKGKVKLKISNKHHELDQPLKSELMSHLQQWISIDHQSPYNFEVTDLVFRRAGLGSLGLKRYLILLKSTSRHEKYMFIDMKESRRSALMSHLAETQPTWVNESTRVVEVQKRMQNVPPALLSTTLFKGTAFVLEELQPTKDQLNLFELKDDFKQMLQSIRDMAIITASAHLRSAARQGADPPDKLIAFGGLTDWQEPLTSAAGGLYRQLQKDFQAFDKSAVSFRAVTG